MVGGGRGDEAGGRLVEPSAARWSLTLNHSLLMISAVSLQVRVTARPPHSAPPTARTFTLRFLAGSGTKSRNVAKQEFLSFPASDRLTIQALTKYMEILLTRCFNKIFSAVCSLSLTALEKLELERASCKCNVAWPNTSPNIFYYPHHTADLSIAIA